MRGSARYVLDVGVAVLVGALVWAAAQASRRMGMDLDRTGPWRRGGPVPGGHDWSGAVWWTPLPFVAALVLGLAVRRLSPRAGFCLVVAAVAGYLAVGGPLGPVLLGPALAVYAMSVTLPPRAWVPYTGLLLPMLAAGWWDQPYLGLFDPGAWAGVIVGVAVSLVPAMVGLLRRNRQQVARAERAAELRRHGYEERLRVAREVHDVVGHSLSVISMQAGVALHVLATRPEQVAESLTAIRSTSKQALAELRTTLDVFRDPDAPLAPSPGLARLPELVSSLRAAGRDVTVTDRRTGVPVPAAVDLAALRIVQESLTNVVRHTAAAAVEVELSDADGRLRIDIHDDGPGTSGLREGSGITGMRERARTVGGSLRVGPGVGGGVRVEAELPLVPARAEEVS